MPKKILLGVLISILASILLGSVGALVDYFLVVPDLHIDATPNPVALGQPVRLSWTSKNADVVELADLPHKPRVVDAQGAETVVVSGETTIEVRALAPFFRNLGLPEWTYTTVRDKTIEILPKPTVRFWADPPDVISGEYTTLKWETNRAKTVLLYGVEASPVKVDPSGANPGQQRVRIDSTKRFKLKASNEAGEVSETLDVPAREPDIAVSLTVFPTDVMVGDYTALTWHSENATSVSIDGMGPVELQGTRRIRVSEPRVFTAIASRGGSTPKSASVTVSVHRPRLVFLGVTGAPLEVDAAVRAGVENHFRSMGYEIQSLRAGPMSLSAYRGAGWQTTAPADYAVACSATITGGPQTRGGSLLRGLGIDRRSISADVAMSMVRLSDGTELSASTGKGGSSSTAIATPYGGFSRASPEMRMQIDAVRKAVLSALSNLVSSSP